MRKTARETSAEVRGALLPLAHNQWLVPNAAVAEVINYQAPQPLVDAPPWLKGHLAWRGEIIPLVAPDLLFGDAEVAPGHRARIVVCNSLGKSSRMPYFGLLTQALPHLILLTADNLSSSGDEGDEPWVLARVKAGGTEALIPDLDALEQALLDHLNG